MKRIQVQLNIYFLNPRTFFFLFFQMYGLSYEILKCIKGRKDCELDYGNPAEEISGIAFKMKISVIVYKMKFLVFICS
jgi:hypothetical protein